MILEGRCQDLCDFQIKGCLKMPWWTLTRIRLWVLICSYVICMAMFLNPQLGQFSIETNLQVLFPKTFYLSNPICKPWIALECSRILQESKTSMVAPDWISGSRLYFWRMIFPKMERQLHKLSGKPFLHGESTLVMSEFFKENLPTFS